MKKSEDQPLILIIIILPLFIAGFFDILPYTKTIQNLWSNIQKGNGLENDMQWIENANAILRQQPWQLSLWDKLAGFYYENNNYSEVINSLQNIEMKQPLTVNQSIILGHSYWQTDQFEYANAYWSNAIHNSNVESDDLQDLFQIQHSSSDWFGAIQTLEMWQQLEPKNKEVLSDLIFLQIIFDPIAAKETIKKSEIESFETFLPDLDIILDSDNSTYQLVLGGNLLSRNGEWDYSTIAYSYVTKVDPNYAEGWALYGNSLINSGENGYFALEKAISISPTSPIAQAYLASYWRAQGDYLKSLEIYNTLVKKEPEQAVWYQEIGNTYIQAGDLDSALEYFQKTTEIDANNVYYWTNLAKFSGEYRVEIQTIGIPAARQALLLDEEKWESYDLLGWLYLLLDDYTSAERFFTIAYEKSPESSMINLHLGQLYSVQNRTALAEYYLSRSIKFAESNEIVELAKKFLSP